MLFCVNGTLMRGLELNRNMLEAGAQFVCETTTAPFYRLWSIDDRYPAMIRSEQGGAAIAIELWEVDAAGLVQILLKEPPGLSVGWVQLIDGSAGLGVLAEPYLVEDRVEITAHGGWRQYTTRAARDSRQGSVSKTGPIMP
jgi:gamma-glutamylcyclotransferase (GGCT)/AIG2-like uncharacterized protein YtfP